MKIERYNPTKEQNVKIGERLKLIRTANELSVEEFASRICCHPFDYSRVKRAVETFSDGVLKLISYEFGVSLSWILQGIPAENDPAFCTEDENGKQMFDSCISVQEAIWDYTTDNGADMWSNRVEKAIDDIHSYIKYLCRELSDRDESRIDNELRDAISMANYDGYTAGWRTAVQLIRGMLNISSLPDVPPAAQSSDKVISPTIITAVRKVKVRRTNNT